MLGDWLAHAQKYGRYARGLFVRRKFKEFAEILRRSRELFRGLAIYKGSTRTWHFWNGATLELAYLKRDRDAEDYQGFSFTWLCVEEMGNFASPKPIDLLRATLRTGSAPIPTYFRATANPGGVGHTWLKARYIDPAPQGMTPFYDEDSETWRVFIPSRLEDNKILMENDPDYRKNIKAATLGDEALYRAWMLGDWDIVAGGLLSSVWNRKRQVIEPFDVGQCPTWFKDRTLDWGSSKPYGVCFWAESDGTTAPNRITYPAGSIFLFAELYGWDGKTPNVGSRRLAVDVADDIVDFEAAFDFDIFPGPADSMIFDVASGLSTESIADQFAKRGVYWLRADKRPGSRIAGAEKLRSMLSASLEYGYEEDADEPGLYIFNTCKQWIRTVPLIPRDDKKPDDANTASEDHLYDATRYRLVQIPQAAGGAGAGGEREEFKGW